MTLPPLDKVITSGSYVIIAPERDLRILDGPAIGERNKESLATSESESLNS